MKTITLLSRTVTIDTKGLGEGVLEMHNSDPDKKAVLSIGMLDAGIMECFERQLTERLESEFSTLARDLYPEEIERFKRDCIKEVTIHIYQGATMIV